MLTITMKSLFFFYISFTITTDVTCCKAEIKTKNTKLGNANEVDLALVMSYLRLLFSPSRTETKSHPYGRVTTLEPGIEFRLN